MPMRDVPKTKAGKPCSRCASLGKRCYQHPARAARKKKRGKHAQHKARIQKRKALQEAFLKHFEETGNLTLSCRELNIGRRTHYDWLKADPDYADAFEDANEAASDLLEAEAHRRAVEGVRKPVGFYLGQPGAYVREYSDTLLIFLLKGRRPAKYRDRMTVTGAGGGPVQTDSTGIDVSKLSSDTLRRIRRDLAEAEDTEEGE